MYITHICMYIYICMHILMSSKKKKSIVERNFVLVALKYFISN